MKKSSRHKRTPLCRAAACAALLLACASCVSLQVRSPEEAAAWGPCQQEWTVSGETPLSSPQALFDMGKKYFTGHGAPRDFEKAAVCFGEAAEHGHGEAAYQLGIMHLNGWGVKKDIPSAARLFARAAAAGDNEARHQLAVLYFSADEFGEAFKWALPAARENHAKSQFLMGLMFMEAGDQEMAALWLRRSAASGYFPATGILATLDAPPREPPDLSAPLPREMLVNPF